MDEKLNILWHSNANWANTGYGVQTATFTPRIHNDLGHDVIVSAFYGLDGARMKFGDIMVVPCHADPYGNDMLRAHMKFLQRDMLITLCDVWVLDPEKTKTMPWAAWTPVDHDPAPHTIINSLKDGKGVPIAMSKFGRDALHDAGFDPLYVPHSPDETFFNVMGKDEAKAKFDLEDKFVFGMVAANKGYPSRKSFPLVFEAFSDFVKDHPDAVLYLHTAISSPYGLRLDDMLKSYEVPKENVRWVDQYDYLMGLGSSYMRDAFNMMDVLLNPSMGEGFGVPVIEAQACRTPVITTDFSAMSELTFFGTAVGYQRYHTNQGSFQAIPNVKEIYSAMEKYYNMDKEEREDQGNYARDKALEYHPDAVLENHWKPTIEAAWERIQKRDDLDLDNVEVIQDITEREESSAEK